MASEQKHPYDGVAQDLLDWMTTETDYYVEAMRGGYRAPFAAEVTEKQKHDYYSRKMFKAKPDGSIQYDQPNPEGRDELLKQLGTTGYAQVYDTVRPKQGRRPTIQDHVEATITGQPALPQNPEPSSPEPPEPTYGP